MLQGNPFETQLEVDERTAMVQKGVAQQRGTRLLSGFRIAEGGWRSAIPSFDWRSFGAPSAQAIRTHWWVPAGLAFLILVGSILGG
jgi:hypothetical protein